ncbi:hypothetical protein D6I95_12495 [Alcaligenes faecalis]|nr:hypothetical protein D6I95_12495 [Alcaligenes faecalis]
MFFNSARTRGGAIDAVAACRNF